MRALETIGSGHDPGPKVVSVPLLLEGDLLAVLHVFFILTGHITCLVAVRQTNPPITGGNMAEDTSYGTFETLTAPLRPDLRDSSSTLREVIIGRHKDDVEIVWENLKIASYGVGPKKMSEHCAYIAVLKNHINLGFYHGASLVDPDSLLEGTGKRLRHVKIRNTAQASDVSIKHLVAESIEELRDSLA
jgi:hypothetical protein